MVIFHNVTEENGNERVDRHVPRIYPHPWMAQIKLSLNVICDVINMEICETIRLFLGKLIPVVVHNNSPTSKDA